jgi:nitroimidazol reductase NimA-like FMN-containing flavoprotein (pyridoxamine 5'-phosphate oxidase superfamily)
MKSAFEIKDQEQIKAIIDNAQYGTLALCSDNIPYSVPLNFTYLDGSFYFHGSKNGKKMQYIQSNPNASFSIVEDISFIPSYFSSDEGLSCPATHFFKSLIIQGKIEIVEDYQEKIDALQSLMQKLQPEGKYKDMNEDIYQKMINATAVFKLDPDEIRGKVKLGQHLPRERFELIIKHLKNRNTVQDKQTLQLMMEIRNVYT